MDEREKELLTFGREHYQKGEHVLGQVLELSDRFTGVHAMLELVPRGRGDQAQRAQKEGAG